MSYLHGSQYFMPRAVTGLSLQSWQSGSLVNTLKLPSGWRIRITSFFFSTTLEGGILQEDADLLA